MAWMRALGLVLAGVLAAIGIHAQPIGAPLVGRVTLHAHNCYPEEGRWTDRLDRALGTHVLPIAIEQDVVWYVDPATGKGRSVLAHGGDPTGKEPTLDEYFFARVRPIVERAIAENHRETWPVVYLHFNVRGLEAPHLQYIWDMLGRYESWLTTAERRADDRLMPLKVGPLMVLTEDGQDEIFYDRDRKSTRLNSSHLGISYAVFCLKK